MITKIFSCVLWVLMHIQLIWYAKVSFSRKDTQLQTFVNDKIQKGCKRKSHVDKQFDSFLKEAFVFGKDFYFLDQRGWIILFVSYAHGSKCV